MAHAMAFLLCCLRFSVAAANQGHHEDLAWKQTPNAWHQQIARIVDHRFAKWEAVLLVACCFLKRKNPRKCKAQNSDTVIVGDWNFTAVGIFKLILCNKLPRFTTFEELRVFARNAKKAGVSVLMLVQLQKSASCPGNCYCDLDSPSHTQFRNRSSVHHYSKHARIQEAGTTACNSVIISTELIPWPMEICQCGKTCCWKLNPCD